MKRIDEIEAEAWLAVHRRESLSVSEWADRFRVMARGTTAKAMRRDVRYSTASAPHQREVQASFVDPAVQVTVMIMASQIGGKTEMVNNALGYHMHWMPTAAVVMYPTIEAAEKYSKRKFSPMVNSTPELTGLMCQARWRNSGNTILTKDFAGGSIFFVGANSPASLRGASGQILIGDEIDSYEESAGNEGDPIELLWKRGESYPNCVKILASTPTVKGFSRIWSWFELSDQRYWWMPCIHCGKEIRFFWRMVKWPDGKPEEAVIECDQCSKTITDRQRLEMYHAGGWKPEAKFSGIRGYHLNWLHCPWPAQKGYRNRLHQFATEWVRATQKGAESLKVLINTGHCECWEEETEKAPDWQALLLRCETYETEIPEKVVYLTASVDVQNDRLEYEIVGWGIGEESWGIETGKIFGSPFTGKVWEEIDAILLREFQHPSGAKLRISTVLVDSGGQTDNRAFSVPVYRFCRRRQIRHVFACKGSSELGVPLAVVRVQKNGIALQHVGTDVAKSTIYEHLGILEPGPYYCHFPQGKGYDEEYFKQLTAESVTRAKGKRVWKKNRSRNEALDLRVYNLAALAVRNVNLTKVAESIIRTADEAKKPPPTVPVSPHVAAIARAKPNPLRPLRRRIGFVKW